MISLQIMRKHNSLGNQNTKQKNKNKTENVITIFMLFQFLKKEFSHKFIMGSACLAALKTRELF